MQYYIFRIDLLLKFINIYSELKFTFISISNNVMITNCALQTNINELPEYTTKKITALDHEVLVSIKSASINKRDEWISKGKYAKIKLPCIPGSDGCGIYNGEEVIMFPSANWGNNSAFQGKNFEVLGMPKDGTFAEYIYINPTLLFNKPKNLNHLEAACIPLSGLTAWRSLFTKANPVKGENILISGVGGGVATFAFQFAVTFGLNVFVTSGSDDKIFKAINLGAAGGISYKRDGFEKELIEMSGGFDIIIDSAGGPDFHKLVKTCNPGARIVMYGGTLGNMDNINPQALFWKQISIMGSTMGTEEEFREMLNFIETFDVKPIIDSTYELKVIKDAYRRMESSDHFGKIVLNIN